MAGESFVIVIDTPSIKKYVFGTDSLNEVRGASARLDRLNRVEMEKCLREHPDMEHADVELIYANGGSAQFLVHECDESTVRVACTSMVQYIREQTGGEVRVVYGIAPLKDEASYREAVHTAHFQLRCQREFATCHRSAPLIPIMKECDSASHLPAAHIDGSDILSKASYDKRQQGREARRHQLWAEWMQHLADLGKWPAEEHWDKLRCKSITDIGDRSSWRDYIGVVYADGNSMGKIIQALDRPETFRQFSRIVDESIREACFTTLGQISESEVDKVRADLKQHDRFAPLAADILLLGGDDLLVAVPADRALDFALEVTNEFERLTREKIDCLPDAETQQFFREPPCDGGFTISCGVAIAKSNYPFYLSLDLAEQLLKNAKRKDSHIQHPPSQGTARIDFHVVAGANSYALKQVREDTYQVLDDAPAPRTIRPLSCAQLEELRASVQKLRNARFPHSKLHELQESALATEVNQADWRIRDVFARCQHGEDYSQRRALWEAVEQLCLPGYSFNFPWFQKDNQRLLCVADLVDAYHLFQPEP
jgi:hypothetical protein